MPKTERDWYKDRNCTHAHCPNGCEKPQPFFESGELYCGRCWVYNEKLVPMIPCTPEVCDE